MIKLICIDVDGTLVGSTNKVNPRIWDAAKAAQEQNIAMAICTGRPALGNTQEYAQILDPKGWHIFQGGASILNLDLNQSDSIPLGRHWVERLIKQAEETAWVLELYSDQDYVVAQADNGSPASKLAESHAGLLGLPYTPRPFESLKGEVLRAQWVVSDQDMPKVMASAHSELIYSAATSPSVPGSNFISVTAQGVDKCAAIKTLAKKLGVSLEDTMMVGDGHNDISALKMVGYPVAMENAHSDLKEVAQHIVGHVDQGGLAEAILMALK